MADLRRPFESLGYSEVQTYIQSGNVIFETPDTIIKNLETEIEQALQTALGFSVPTFIRTGSELNEVAGYQPFPDGSVAPDAQVRVSFFKQTPSTIKQDKLLAYKNEVDGFHFNGRELYWLWRKQKGASSFSNTRVEKILGQQGTQRNISVIQKILVKFFNAEK